jgi:hypothetical protein
VRDAVGEYSNDEQEQILGRTARDFYEKDPRSRSSRGNHGM